jgi:phospholipase/carboxylesterase
VGASLIHRVREPAGEPAGALVLFHGRGTDEHDLVPLLDALDPEWRLLGVTPRGPLALPPGGAHWYVVREIGYPDPSTFLATYERTAQWLDELADELRIPPGRTVLGGFSQGAVMSYALGLGRDRPRPAAIVALSGFVPTVPGADSAAPHRGRAGLARATVSTRFRHAQPDEQRAGLYDGFEVDVGRPLPPMAIGHGAFDPVISVEWARRARALLESAGARVLYREAPIGHGIDPSFLRVLAPWIADALAAPQHAA